MQSPTNFMTFNKLLDNAANYNYKCKLEPSSVHVVKHARGLPIDYRLRDNEWISNTMDYATMVSAYGDISKIFPRAY